ncbi:MAG TPA: sugar ABC transporter permease [Firmicutes bacterium]|jgi:putative aldouronate transport system permease protein|nr:sugar ABC transporter permease [Bacillota bacterium]
MSKDSVGILKRNDIDIKPSHGFWYELVKNKALFLMLLPGVLVLLFNNYLPMFGIVVAFKDFRFYDGSFFSSLLKSDWSGLRNFTYMFSSPDAFVFIRNTILYNLAFIITCTIIAIAFAIMLNEIYSRKLSKLYQSAMFLPYFLSWIVFSYLVYAFLSPDKGYVNMSILKFVGVKPVFWYSELKYWPWIIMIVNAWHWVGNNCIIFLASIISIDQEMYEAARIDGASRWEQIVHITIPQIMPVIIVMTLIFVGRIFNTDLGLFMIVPRSSGILAPVTWTLDVYVYNTLLRNGDIGMSSAAALFQSVVGFITILAANYAVKKIDRDAGMW